MTTELILAAWIASAALLFLPLGRVARLAQRRLRPARGHAGDMVEPSPDAAPGLMARLAPRVARELRWPTMLALYVVFIVGAAYLAPRAISRALDTPHPMAAITSQSMFPTLKRGDMVFIQGVDKVTDLEVGDIIAYDDDVSGLVIHRIIEIDGEKLHTIGDANLSPDDWISFDQVVGRTLTLAGRMAKVPYLGNLPILFGASSDLEDAEDAILQVPEEFREESLLPEDEVAVPLPDTTLPNNDRLRPLGP